MLANSLYFFCHSDLNAQFTFNQVMRATSASEFAASTRLRCSIFFRFDQVSPLLIHHQLFGLYWFEPGQLW